MVKKSLDYKLEEGHVFLVAGHDALCSRTYGIMTSIKNAKRMVDNVANEAERGHKVYAVKVKLDEPLDWNSYTDKRAGNANIDNAVYKVEGTRQRWGGYE